MWTVGAPLILPSVVDVLFPFVSVRKSAIQTSLPPVQLALLVRRAQYSDSNGSHTLSPYHSCKRLWQVEELLYRSGGAFQRAPEGRTHRIPSRVGLLSARGRPGRSGTGRRGTITSHWPSRRSSLIAQASHSSDLTRRLNNV